jgi:hypothetical protein
MTSDDRVKRPALERSQAIRNWATLFRGPSADGGSAAGNAATAGTEPASFNDVVARSVDLGYRVVDEYIRQGQKAAQRLNERSYGAQTMAGDVQDLAMRMTQYASDFAAVWLQLVQLAATGNGPPSGSPPGDGIERGPSTDAPPSSSERSEVSPPATTRVCIEVHATQPTEVAVDIRPDAATRPLIVHALRAVNPDTPRLDEVSFEPGSDDSPARLRIRVPTGQVAGTYSGLMIDEATSRPVGTVSVTITE